MRNTAGTGLSTSPSIHIVRWRVVTVCDRHDVAGFGLVIELQLDPTCLKLPQHVRHSPLDFLAELTQHIPPQEAHLIRYYGWYSNKSRGMRKKAAAEAAAESPTAAAAEGASPGRSSQSWAMLIKRVYEVDPLSCPGCGVQMAVVGFIEPPQRDVIEKILSHCGLWRSAAARAPPADSIDPSGDGSGSTNGSDNEPAELTYVDMATF